MKMSQLFLVPNKGGDGNAVTYLLRAWDASVGDQGYADAQVLDTVAELGDEYAGQMTVVELDGTLAASGGALVFTAQSTPAWEALGAYSGALTRALGLALMGTFSFDKNYKNAIITLQNNGDITLANRVYQLRFTNGGVISCVVPSTETYETDVYAASTDYAVAFVLGGYDANGVPYRSGETESNYLYGIAMFVKIAGAWTLLMRSMLDNTATLYAAFSNYEQDGTLQDLRVADQSLKAVLEPTDYAATPGAGTTFTQTADCWLSFEADTLPSSGQIEVEFRRQDANNKWRVTIDSIGTIDLDEVVSGTPTQRGTAVAVVSAGEIVVVHMADDDITVFVGGAEEFAYASATNFKTETAGEVETLGTGGVVKELHTNARTSAVYETEFGSV